MDEQRIPHGPQWNALKHGFRSATALLPGDNAAEFQALRCELFQDYNPCTRDEADCVESLADYKWRIAHCRRLEAKFRAALNQVAGVYPAEDHICEPDPHRWQHRAMDCTLEERRLHRLLETDRKTLFELQRMRRNRLIDGAVHVTKSYRDFLGDEAALQAPQEPSASRQPSVDTGSATPSADESIADFHERESRVSPTPVLRVGEVTAWLVREGVESRANPLRSAAGGACSAVAPFSVRGEGVGG